ncbi:ABC transporter substrate-binding protein [Paenibacillus sp. SYP-B4298]|uniref:ABC transporter substrate-binding protein n=1 Tax=Paenibacillus sp. SYP-B4298 TaxID=2996034 RepID=UPI0022DDB3AE|nr:extracellular solute-binding protein [Paenibacillus sp. SYP-B4298]
MQTKKPWLVMLLSLTLIFGLAACSSGSGGGGTNTPPANGDTNTPKTDDTGSKGSDEKIELSFWILGTPGYEDLVKEWNATHPNVQIKYQTTGDQTAHHNNLTTALSANSGAPDIFMLEIGFMERFITAEDKFHNLNELGAQDLQSQYLDWKWKQASSIDGSFQIGLPTDIGPTVAYYRVDQIEQAGLPVDPDEFSAAIDTWDKFAAVGKAFKEKTGKPFADLKDLTFNALRDQATDVIYFSKEDGSFIGDTNPQVRKAYDFTVKGIQEGWIGNWALWSPEWGQATNDGSFGVMLGPAWMAGNIKGNGPDSSGKWKIAQLPEGSGNWGGAFLTLPKEGKHPKEAFEFIKWVTGKENQLVSFKTKGLMPSIPELYTDEAFTGFQDEFFGGQATAVEFGKAANRVKPVYYGPLHDQTDTYFKDALQNVMEKKADPEAEWKAAVEKAKKLAERS